jgi:protein-S-isoprenylcysteine O-methyltransferase Ste14
MPLHNEMVAQGNFLFRYRSYLPLIILLPAIVLYSVNNNNVTFEKGAWEYGCLAISLLGLGIRVICVGFSFENTSGRNTCVGQVADDVNTSGMYSMVRHPLYLGNFFMWFGLALFTQQWWFILFFIVFYAFYYERIMLAEEDYLITKFDDKYTTWAENTPAFIPDFKAWKKPCQHFSILKVIKQEKAGIVNLFLIILIFKIAALWYSGQKLSVANLSNIWTYFLIFALAYYIVVKILMRSKLI